MGQKSTKIRIWVLIPDIDNVIFIVRSFIGAIFIIFPKTFSEKCS